MRGAVRDGVVDGAVRGAMHRPVNHCPMDCSPAMRRTRGVMRWPRGMAAAAGMAAGVGVVSAVLFSQRGRCRHFTLVLCSGKLSQVSLVPAAALCLPGW